MSNNSIQMDYDDHRLLWDGICNHTINSMYAALTLYIIGTDDWKRDFKGRNPKYFHAHIKDWLCKYSQYASVLYNSYDPIVRKKYLKIKQGNVVPSDILRNFISLSFNKKFFINKFGHIFRNFNLFACAFRFFSNNLPLGRIFCGDFRKFGKISLSALNIR